MSEAYSDDSIVKLEKLDHIRHRPTAYITDTGEGGQLHIVTEPVDNAIDELTNFLAPDSQLSVFMFKDVRNRKYQIMITDNGRGIPLNKLIDVFTNPQTSGKFDTAAYKFSAGTFGVGGKATTALSDYFRVVTFKDGMIADAIIHHSDIPPTPTIMDNPDPSMTGTVLIFEPDAEIFEDIEEFSHSGYIKIVEFLTRLSLFAKYRIKFHLFSRAFPEKLRRSPTEAFVKFVLDCQQDQDNVIFDNATFNREVGIKEFFGLRKDFTYSKFIIDESDDNLKYSIDIRSILTHNPPSNTKLTFVNGILFTDGVSFHNKLVNDHIREGIAKLITDNKVREFFKKYYKIPLWFVMDIKFSGAQFSGTIKHQFRDIAFKKVFSKVMPKLMAENSVIPELHELLAEHIVAGYERHSNSDLLVGNTKNMLRKLNRPKKFSDCSTNEREKAELFLVEGDSAKSDQGRDSEFQATYLLSGKPLNSITTVGKMSDSLDNLRRNPIYQDIIRILGIIPGSDDLSNLNFGKLFITTDADVHGYHIASILLSNLYVLCPALIEEGRIFIVIPPLYGLTLKGSNDVFYVRDAQELNATLAYQLYYRCFDLSIESNAYDRQRLNREEFVAFSEIITKVGEVIDNLSKEYSIPAVILEQLSLMTGVLNSSLVGTDVSVMEKAFNCPIKYHQDSQVMILQIGSDDIIIPLLNINELIYKKILPLYKDFFYSRLRIFVTTKRTDTYKESPVTIVQMYQMFKQLDGLFKTKRYKGLGSMNPADRSRTCINPETRRTFQITTVGDIDSIFNMMGSNSAYRKELVLS